MQEEVPFNIGLWYDEVMISERSAKLYCSDDISLIENYHQAIADKEKMWDIHHRRECDDEGRTLFTKKQLIEINLYYKRPASELIFVTKSMHKKIHREMCSKGGKISGGSEAAKKAVKEKCSIPIIQFTKSGEFIKEWQSACEAQRRLGIAHSSIDACLKSLLKHAGGFIWRYKDSK